MRGGRFVVEVVTVDADGRVAITLPDVRAWTLSPTEHERLHHYLSAH
jgi:hypothetical protein